MNSDRWISSPGIRIVTAVLALVFATLLSLYLQDRALERLLLPVIASGMGTAIGILFSFRPVYTLWMQFAERLQTVMSALLFGGCYLFLVPWLTLITRFTDPLKLRPGLGANGTYWIQRPKRESDPRSYQRMG